MTTTYERINASYLLAMTEFAGKDKWRPVLSSVAISKHGSMIEYAGTDSYRLARIVEDEKDGDAPEFDPFPLPVDMIKNFVKAKSAPTVELVDGVPTRFICDGATVELREIGRYPSYSGLLNDSMNGEAAPVVSLNSDYVMSVSKAAKKAKIKTLTYEARGPEKPIFISGKTESNDAVLEAMIVPVRM